MLGRAGEDLGPSWRISICGVVLASHLVSSIPRAEVMEVHECTSARALRDLEGHLYADKLSKEFSYQPVPEGFSNLFRPTLMWFLTNRSFN